MLNRRELIKRLTALPFLGGITSPEIYRPPSSLINGLGIRTFINAAGTYTAMSGSLMPEEVVEAIRTASAEFMMLDEVQTKVGERIAAITHAEAATVTAGCFSALTLGLAGVLTGTDPEKVKALPHLEGTGMKSEVILQKGHTNGYTQALTNTGCRLVYIETREELEKAIGPQTALMWFLHIQSDKGQIGHEEWVSIARKHQIPTMIDIAADVPPVENLWKFNDMGFDLVCISGGKAMRGPQSAGILMGKKRYIEAARLSAPPRGSTIGRGMKVNKEEIIGMLAALERFVRLDHQKEWETWEKRVAHIESAAQKVSGVITTVTRPPLGNHTPTLKITWNPEKIRLSAEAFHEKLRWGNPSIEVASGGENAISVTTWMLKPGQEKVVATRIYEILSEAKA